MASAASHVYTRLGVEVLENWTKLTNEMKKLREKIEESRGDEVDKLLQEIHVVGMQISKIEDEAAVPPDLRS